MADKKNIDVQGFDKVGQKPVQGAPSGTGFVRQLDENGRIIDARTSGAPLDTANVVSPEEYSKQNRIGDYYYDRSGSVSVVPNSPTDIANKWGYTQDTSLYAKPTRDQFSSGGEATGLVATASGIGLEAAIAGRAAAKAAAAGAAGTTIGALGGATLAGLPFAAISGVMYAQQVGAEEKAYKEALEKWNESQEKALWNLAGNLTTDENGKIYFTPDASKAINMNAEFAGAELRKAFDRETEVYFGDDGRLKIKVNPVFAATDEFAELVDNVKKAYSGLTADDDSADEAIEAIKGYITDANNQFKFKEEEYYSYKRELPNASKEAIDDAHTNVLGAYMSESDGGDFKVKVLRDGEIVEQSAKEVLENVYDKNLGERSDYMLSLTAKMEDPNLPDDQKAYVLSEIKLLNAADSNDKTYDNGNKDENGNVAKSRNKYYGMLDQESIIPWLTQPTLFGVSIAEIVNAVDKITPWEIHINTQQGLQPDPAATSAAKLIGTATSTITARLAMQGIEYGVVRPIVGKVAEGLGKAINLERIAANGGRLSDFIGNIQLMAGAFANRVSEVAPKLAEMLAGARLTASPLASTLGYSMSELLYNASSDLVYDAAKQGLKALAGEEPTSEDFLEEFGMDLVMDLVMQYGPAGIASMQTELDNNRLEAAYAPYREGLEDALRGLDTAELDYMTTKEILADMRKGTKKYAAAEEDLAAKRKNYDAAQERYQKLRTEADAAIKEAFPSMSEELGAAMAGRLSQVEQNNVILWLRKKLLDENAGLSTVAQQAYAKTSDVYLYAAAVNKFQSIQANIKEVQTKMLSDMYVKGTGQSFTDFSNAVSTAVSGAKFSKTQTEYLVAKAEYDSWMRTAENDAELAKRVEEKYAPYLNKVQGVEREQLNNVLETLKRFLQKVGENYVKSGAATEKQMKDIETAALGNGYIPLWGKDLNLKTFGIFETPLTLRVGRTFDEEQGLFDVEGVRNPVESAIFYAHNVINNIARNEMAAMLKEIASIDGVDIELVGGGAKAGREYQDIIDQAIDRVARSKEKLLSNEVPVDKYESGLSRRLSSKEGSAAIKGIDDLIPKQKQLQHLVELNNTETDLAKRARRLTRIANLDAEIRAQKTQVRADIDQRVRVAGEYFNKTYSDLGFTVDIDNTLTSKKYTDMIDGRLNTMSTDDLVALKSDIDKVISQVAPYLPIKKINKKAMDAAVKGLRVHARNRIKQESPDMSNADVDKKVNQITANFKAQVSGDYSQFDTSDTDTTGGYKINFTSDGKDASFYIKGKLAKEVATEMNSKNLNDRRVVSEFFKQAANVKRLLTTGLDPTRVLPNLLRDTIRNTATSGGTDYWFYDKSPFGFQSMFTTMAKAAGDSDEDIENAFKVMRASQEVASGATYNEAFSGRRSDTTKRLVQYSVEQGSNRGTRIIWNLAHNKRGMLEAPMNWAEGLTRNRAAASAFYRAYMRGAGVLDQETRLNNAFQAGVNAGRENTVNFMRRGTAIKQIAAYVPYLSQKFSSIESTKIAFLKDPIGVSSRIMMFGAAYMMELSQVLSNDESRKNYYNLSEYDRESNIILSLGDNTLVTIPLDETLAKLIYPWRRGLETLNNVDPEAFYKIMIASFANLSPFDLSGFSEGDSFNFGRGMEKLGAEMLPTILQSMYTQASGRNLYYGSTVGVTAEDLAEYGVYDPSAGDYTTAGANSQLLRSVADMFGIEQWRLQQLVSDLGGNVGQYVVNILDRIGGAPEDAQGGKDFIEATYKSFTGMDSNQVYYAFNDGIAQLQQEKEKVKAKLKSINSQISLASGERLAELQNQYSKVRQEFSLKVGNFVEKYLNAYEIAGGLTRTQANKLWYLFDFSEDESISMGQSVEADYRSQAQSAANKETTKYAASVLDKYYDQTKNVYKDDDGVWHYYAPYGEQAFFNTIKGSGTKYMVGLKNILEGKNTNLYSARSAARTARSAAANAGNWDEYDRLGLVFDEQVLSLIAPYVEQNGADAVLQNSTVLDYLRDWFFVPSNYMKSKYGKNVSLAHNASKQEAFVRPYIKELFGLSTAYQDRDYATQPERLVRGE